MELFHAVIDTLHGMTGLSALLLPLGLTLILYVCLGRKSELGPEAIANTAATIVVGGLNFFVAILFYKQINDFAQNAYDRLMIPTIDPTIWEQTPLWLVCLIGLVAKDFADYWNHRLMHTRWGWPAHAAHHSDTYVNAFTAYRIHFIESLIMSFSYIILLTWLQIPAAIPFVAVLSVLHNMYVHMDLEIDHGPFRYLVASPVFHRWHHADEPAAYGKNLANIMPLWDKLFGTYYMPGKCEAEMGALKTGVEDKNPFLIYAYPVLEWSRLIRTSLGGVADQQDQADIIKSNQSASRN